MAIGIAILSLAVAIAAVIFSYTVPQDLDRQAWNRQLKQNCIDSVIDLRGAVNSLQGVYTIGLSDKAAAQAQWQTTQLAVDRTQVSCIKQLPSDLASRGSTLWALFQTSKEQADQGSWDATNSSEILTWTQDTIKALTA